jgi:hypothetical protein
MKYRWRDGKVQAIAYVPALGRCAVVKEADSLHKLYGDDEDDEDDEDDQDDEDDEDEEY